MTRNPDLAISQLISAIERMPDGTPPMSQQLQGTWGTVGRSIIASWVKDLGRYLGLIASALERARGSPMKETGIAALEDVLWRLDASREKLHAILSLSLGVPHIDVDTDPVRFRTFPNEISAALRGLPHPAGTKLDQIGKRLADHRAIKLRNQLSHGVAPLTQVQTRCFFEAVAYRDQEIGQWSNHVDYPPGWRAYGDIKPETMWAGAVQDATEALDILTECVELLAELVVQTGAKLPPPQRVYRDTATGRVSLSDPRR